ncbi:MAG: hypothetical protein EOM34_10745 [Clostridia bacterium]|nr:hypothetical protein [Lachnospiraceae bacterium]NCC01135.1 hypothetical protein [Clostridia bacterium]NCD03034.1 hypothetical protein [Clostridia bacterium]
MGEKSKRVITVLFVREYCGFSNFIYFVTGRGYTHASLSLDEENEKFYSFNFKGFRIEHPKKHSDRYGESAAYCLEVTEEEYEQMKQRIEEMESNSEQLSYSSLGVFFCLLHIPLKIKNRYFCSQFVAEMLQQTKTVRLQKKPSLYYPNKLVKALENQCCLQNISYNAI